MTGVGREQRQSAPGPPAANSATISDTMNTMRDRGVQASVVTAGVLGVVTAVAYSPALLAVWGVWAGVTGWAVYEARRKNARA